MCVRVYIWQMGSLITREKGYTPTHTHTQEENTHMHTHTRAHTRAPGLTFSLSSIVPSAWLTLTSEAAGLITSWGE